MRQPESQLARSGPDQGILESLLSPEAARPRSIRPRESAAMRLLVVVASPAWLSAIIAAFVFRLARRRRPLLVLHERVGLGRRALLVPKIATAAVASNRQRFGGLVEIARGTPTPLLVEDGADRWLRRTGVDELPQLLLVLSGAMRIVGPRPVSPSELAETGAGEVGVDILAPGLTGLWQVLDRHAYSLGDRHALDLLMVENWGPQLRRRLLSLTARQTLARLLHFPEIL